MKEIAKAVFGYGRPSLRAMGLTSATRISACAENRLRCLNGEFWESI
jgi:hypothetical protein